MEGQGLILFCKYYNYTTSSQKQKYEKVIICWEGMLWEKFFVLLEEI